MQERHVKFIAGKTKKSAYFNSIPNCFMAERVHVVCLDSPSPPDYGGAIDMFYKIKALQEIGLRVVLHYFAYKNNRPIEAVLPFCEAVYAYERKPFIRSLHLPYSVASRIHQGLARRLNED